MDIWYRKGLQELILAKSHTWLPLNNAHQAGQPLGKDAFATIIEKEKMTANFLNSQMWNSEGKPNLVQGPQISSTTSHPEIQLVTHWVTTTVLCTVLQPHTHVTVAQLCHKVADFSLPILCTHSIWSSVFRTGPITWFTAVISLMPQQSKREMLYFMCLYVSHLSFCIWANINILWEDSAQKQ